MVLLSIALCKWHFGEIKKMGLSLQVEFAKNKDLGNSHQRGEVRETDVEQMQKLRFRSDQVRPPRPLPGAAKLAWQSPLGVWLRRCWTPCPGSDSAHLGRDLRVHHSDALRWTDVAGSPWKNPKDIWRDPVVFTNCRGGNDPILSESQRKGWFPGYEWVVYKESTPNQWTWVWTNFRRRRRTGKPGVLPSMGLQRVRPDFVTEQQQYKESPSSCQQNVVEIHRRERT